MKHLIATLVALVLCLPAFAGGKEEQEEWMKKMREKEAQRAAEMARMNSNDEHMAKKYGHLKESHPEKYEAMMQARKRAAEAWKKVGDAAKKAEGHEQIQEMKTPAYDAQEAAAMAHLEMTSAEAISRWKHMADKADSEEAKALAAKLVANQKMVVEVQRTRMEAQKKLRQLELEQRRMEKEMHGIFKQADAPRQEGESSSREKHKSEKEKGKRPEK